MKLQSALFACLALGAVTMSGTVANGIPSAEMFQATTIEEYQRLRSLPGGSSINETLKEEIYQLKKERQLLELSQPLLASSFNGTPGFYHGVASGDPLPDAVILWTRYTPLTADANITLELRITPLVPGLETSAHLDPNANGELRRVAVIVTSASDWIAKIDVTQLSSNTNYVFAFADASNNVSPIGQTRTAPDNDADVSQMVYAVFSCANFGNGYFHAYDIASTIQNLDFWVHVGDYIVSPVLSFARFCIYLYVYGLPVVAYKCFLRSMSTDPIQHMRRIKRNERNKSFLYGKPLIFKTIAYDMLLTIAIRVCNVSGKYSFCRSPLRCFPIPCSHLTLHCLL